MERSDFTLPDDLWTASIKLMQSAASDAWDLGWKKGWNSGLNVLDDALPSSLAETAAKEQASAKPDYSAEQFLDDLQSDYQWMDACIVISVKNNGKITANNLKIVANEARGLARITVDRKEPRQESFENEIEIGTLEGGDSAEVTIWPRRFYDTVQIRWPNNSLDVSLPKSGDYSFFLLVLLPAGGFILFLLLLDYVDAKRKLIWLEKRLSDPKTA
jgi:hypothetical protein